MFFWSKKNPCGTNFKNDKNVDLISPVCVLLLKTIKIFTISVIGELNGFDFAKNTTLKCHLRWVSYARIPPKIMYFS